MTYKTEILKKDGKVVFNVEYPARCYNCTVENNIDLRILICMIYH